MTGALGGGGSEPSFYETLGVGEEANAAEIRVAYRERAKNTHPDVSDAPDAGRRFRRVKRAHEVLTDDVERRRYDRLGHEAYVALDDPRPGRNAAAAGSRTAGDGSAAGSAGRATTDPTDDRTGSGGASAGSGTNRSASGRSNGGSRGWNGGRSRTETATGTAAEGSPIGQVAYALARWLGLAGTLVDAWQSQLGPAGAAIALATFAAYPVLLASTVTPLFPLPVNLLVGLCTLAVLGYLVVRPAVGVAVLGTWLLVLPVVLTLSGIGVFSLGGLYALVLTGVPLVLCVATLVGVSV